jgi:hypothetical protein
MVSRDGRGSTNRDNSSIPPLMIKPNNINYKIIIFKSYGEKNKNLLKNVYSQKYNKYIIRKLKKKRSYIYEYIYFNKEGIAILIERSVYILA